MKAVPMAKRPDFPLMRQGDIQTIYHLQMPRWLFTDPRYLSLALEAKVAYTFLLNRFQLSRLNGWMNDQGEVFIVYTRRSLAAEMQVSYHKILSAMKELAGAGLIWERRCGRGDANQIYLARVEPAQPGPRGSAPFVDQNHEAAGGEDGQEDETSGGQREEGGGTPAGSPAGTAFRSAESELHDEAELPGAAPMPAQEVPDPDLLECGFGTSRSPSLPLQEVPMPDPNHTDQSYPERSDTQSSPSASPAGRIAPKQAADGPTRQEMDQLAELLSRCELWAFDRETALVLTDAIERLFFSQQLRVGRALLPQASVRSRLWELDHTVLQTAVDKLRRNQREIKNTTGYIMAVVFNTICEARSDLLVDPYLNHLREGVPESGREGPGCS